VVPGARPAWLPGGEAGGHLEVHRIQAGPQLLHGVHLRLQLQQVARRGARALGHLRPAPQGLTQALGAPGAGGARPTWRPLTLAHPCAWAPRPRARRLACLRPPPVCTRHTGVQAAAPRHAYAGGPGILAGAWTGGGTLGMVLQA